MNLLKQVSDRGAWYYPYTTTTHPDSKRYFNVFSSPNVHSFIASSNFIEVSSVYRKQTSYHDWRLYRC